MRAKIRQTVSQLQPYDSLERAHIAATLDWIDSGAELFRQTSPDIPPRHLVSYFLLVDGDWVLLVDHIKAGLWLPSGGHVDPGENPNATVAREIREELSIEANFLCEGPQFLTIAKTNQAQGQHEDVSLWYLMRGDRTGDLDYDRGEFHAVKWFHVSDVPLAQSDPNMGRFLDKCRELKVFL